MSFSDNFNRASLGSTWETVEGTAWVIASSLYLKPVTVYGQTGVRVVGAFPADQLAEVWTEIPTPGGGDSTYPGPAVRMGASGDCYYLRLTTSNLTLYKHVAGVDTYLSDVTLASALDTMIKLKLTVTGTTLEAFSGDVSRFTLVDASLAAGNPGCHAITGQSSLLPRFDDFLGTGATVSSGVTVLVGSHYRQRRSKR